MGHMTTSARNELLKAYSTILSVFTSIENVHGFIYFIMILGGYVLAYFSIKQNADKDDFETSTKIIRNQSAEYSELMATTQLLRNYFAHWTPARLAPMLNSMLISLYSSGIQNIEDSTLRHCYSVLYDVDWNMIKDKLKEITPSLDFSKDAYDKLFIDPRSN